MKRYSVHYLEPRLKLAAVFSLFVKIHRVKCPVCTKTERDRYIAMRALYTTFN